MLLTFQIFLIRVVLILILNPESIIEALYGKIQIERGALMEIAKENLKDQGDSKYLELLSYEDIFRKPPEGFSGRAHSFSSSAVI